MYTLLELQNIIEKEIEDLKLLKAPQQLYEPIEYVLSIGGKRIRPALCLMAEQMFSNQVNKSISAAIGLEIFHNFTLLHDDIMDNADVRRNQQTVHKKWDVNTGILSGDAMLIKAYEFIAKTDKIYLPEVITLFNKTALEVCEGQQYDIDFESKTIVSTEQYIEMIRLKTAVLIAASLKSGAIIGGANDLNSQLVYDFGIAIGLAFQLQDDILDVFGTQAEFGKKIGGDIIANKKTFLLISALQHADKSQLKTLNYWLNNDEFNEQKKIESVTEIFNELNVKEISVQKMEYFFNIAIDCLNSIESDNIHKEELKKFASQLMNRSK